MIYTGSYNNCLENDKNVSISGDRGKGANYHGEYYSLLAPKKEFWTIWHNNIGRICQIENNHFYVREYIKTVLSNLDVRCVFNDLDNYTLLCYEDNNQFCHRHIVSVWLEDELGIIVPEVKYVNGKQEILDKPEIIKEIYLEEKRYLKRK